MSDGTKSEAPLILGVSGLRGIVGESLTPEVAMRYAAAFGTWLARREGDPCTVVVSQDGRHGGDLIYDAAIEGLRSAGCSVIPLGVQMTPTTGTAIDHSNADGGIQVTASHNPQQWNGLKCLVCEWVDREEFHKREAEREVGGSDAIASSIVGARAPTAKEAAEIIELFQSGEIKLDEPRGELLQLRTDALEQHALEIIVDNELDIKQRRYHAVVDSVHASGAVPADRLLREFGCNITQLYGDDSGIFPHTPEPTAENLSGEGGLCDAVPGLKADVGFAQDPDGDRLAIVDEKGNYIGEEYTLVLCAEAVLSAARPPAHAGGSSEGTSPVIVVNLSTSRMVEDVAAAHGAEVVRTPVGEANVVERMKQLKKEGRNVVLGGEGNGGVIWPEVVYVRDSLGSMALVLSLMARTGKTVSELVGQIDGLAPGGAGYAIVKRKVDIPTKTHAQPAVEKVAQWGKGMSPSPQPTAQGGEGTVRVDLQDGVRVDIEDWQGAWDGGGSAWVHVRASNTEPIMRLIAEAGTREGAEGLLAAVERAIGS